MCATDPCTNQTSLWIVRTQCNSHFARLVRKLPRPQLIEDHERCSDRCNRGHVSHSPLPLLHLFNSVRRASDCTTIYSAMFAWPRPQQHLMVHPLALIGTPHDATAAKRVKHHPGAATAVEDAVFQPRPHIVAAYRTLWQSSTQPDLKKQRESRGR